MSQSNRRIFGGPLNPGGIITIGPDASGAQNYRFDLDNVATGCRDICRVTVASKGLSDIFAIAFTDTAPTVARTNPDLETYCAGQPVYWLQQRTSALGWEFSFDLPFNFSTSTTGGSRGSLGRYLWLQMVDGSTLSATTMSLMLHRLSGPSFTDLDGLVALT